MNNQGLNRNMFQPIEISDAATIDEICRFRAQVWMATAGTAADAFPHGRWRDADDDNARHWICRSAEGKLLAAARLAVLDRLSDIIESHEYHRYCLEVDGRVAAPDRVVVSTTAQGCGLAGLLLDEQHRAALESGAVCAARQASPRMVQLLIRRGWQVLGAASIDRRFPTTTFSVAVYVFDASRVSYVTQDNKAA